MGTVVKIAITVAIVGVIVAGLNRTDFGRTFLATDARPA